MGNWVKCTLHSSMKYTKYDFLVFFILPKSRQCLRSGCKGLKLEMQYNTMSIDIEI